MVLLESGRAVEISVSPDAFWTPVHHNSRFETSRPGGLTPPIPTHTCGGQIGMRLRFAPVHWPAAPASPFRQVANCRRGTRGTMAPPLCSPQVTQASAFAAISGGTRRSDWHAAEDKLEGGCVWCLWTGIHSKHGGHVDNQVNCQTQSIDLRQTRGPKPGNSRAKGEPINYPRPLTTTAEQRQPHEGRQDTPLSGRQRKT